LIDLIWFDNITNTTEDEDVIVKMNAAMKEVEMYGERQVTPNETIPLESMLFLGMIAQKDKFVVTLYRAGFIAISGRAIMKLLFGNGDSFALHPKDQKVINNDKDLSEEKQQAVSLALIGLCGVFKRHSVQILKLAGPEDLGGFLNQMVYFLSRLDIPRLRQHFLRLFLQLSGVEQLIPLLETARSELGIMQFMSNDPVDVWTINFATRKLWKRTETSSMSIAAKTLIHLAVSSEKIKESMISFGVRERIWTFMSIFREKEPLAALVELRTAIDSDEFVKALIWYQKHRHSIPVPKSMSNCCDHDHDDNQSHGHSHGHGHGHSHGHGNSHGHSHGHGYSHKHGHSQEVCTENTFESPKEFHDEECDSDHEEDEEDDDSNRGDIGMITGTCSNCFLKAPSGGLKKCSGCFSAHYCER